MGEKFQATPTKQDLGTSWGISGDQSFPRSTPVLLVSPSPPGGSTSPSSLTLQNVRYRHTLYSGRLSRNPLFRNSSNWNHQTKSSTYSTNVMAVIRTGQQNDVILEKRSNSRNFVRKKSGQSSEIDEEAAVVFCLLAYVLT